MSSQPLWFVGNRNPSITETITTSGGGVVDLTTATVAFKMRAVGSATLKVNTTASFKDALGNVRYDWAALDVDTAGQYLVWWEVTLGGKTQDMAEAVIEFRAHANAMNYVELEQLKSTLELDGQTYADQDLRSAIAAACRGIDGVAGRRFYVDADAAQVRYYTPDSTRRLWINDLVTLTSLKVDRSGDGVFEETWTNGTDFVLEPLNAVADARPYESLLVRKLASRWLPCEVEKSVEVTGKFGWATVPDGVKEYAGILAAKLMRRAREAPFGIITVGIDPGAAMRIARTDPDFALLVGDYIRRTPFL